ncbi:MAG TPA: chemotaxis protein CheW [Edaphobacter sp.]|nr:chemotaxis protein CheW [Edaphobacter sp.]
MEATLTAKQNQAQATSTDPRAGKYLIFHLSGEEFAIPVLDVREIIGIQAITSVPQTPAYVRGVINLRGKVIPVIDLRMKFSLPELEYTQRTCIIVVNVRGNEGPLVMAIVVDGVAEVLNIAGGDIEDTPMFGDGTETKYLLGVAKIEGKVKILLDIHRVLTTQEMAGMGSLFQ